MSSVSKILQVCAAALRQLLPVIGLMLLCGVSAPAFAQSSLFSSSPTTGLIAPGPAPGARGESFGQSGAGALPSQSPQAPLAAMPMVPAGQVALSLGARFGKEAPAIGGGLTWRIYAAKTEPGAAFKLIKEDKSASPTMVLSAGNYIVHVGFGLATAVRPVTLRGATVREDFDLPAGGLRLEGRVNNLLAHEYSEYGAAGFDSTFTRSESYFPSPGRNARLAVTYRW